MHDVAEVHDTDDSAAVEPALPVMTDHAGVVVPAGEIGIATTPVKIKSAPNNRRARMLAPRFEDRMTNRPPVTCHAQP